MQCYIHLVEYGRGGCFFDHLEAPIFDRAFMQPIHVTEAQNQIGRSDKESNLPIFPSGHTMNIMEEGMYTICCIGIKMYDENDPAPQNVT